ncbi:hypothetical protein JCM3765_006079 [Sporobolomyces pararoseus]
MLSSIFVTLLATSSVVVSAAPSPFSSNRISGDVVQLAKRASNSTMASPSSTSTPAVAQSSYLQDLFGYQTPSSEKACSVPLSDLETCAKGSNQAEIASCACSTQTLGDLRSCAAAISTSTKSSTNATQVVVSYNAFVDLCQTEGLATVTGTIAAGESTSTVSRVATSSTPSSSASSSSHPTYNAQSTPTSTATVAQLATGSLAPQASGVSNNSKTSTNSASSFVGGSVFALVSAAGLAIYILI